MSTLGPLGGVPAMSAAARILRSNGDVNQVHQNQAVEGQANLRSHQATREIGEDGPGVGDRDADGRQPWRRPSMSDEAAAQSEPPAESSSARSPATGRGQRLDLNL